MTIHHLQHIVDLVEILAAKGIEHVIISPGSRNAPLTRLFSSNKKFTCHSIVDERVAAFYALGISQGIQKPVAIVCTSGTAVLNYAPAIAEAFYQHIPLIAITADRPAHLIDQQDNQTIHQNNVYHNYCKKSINLTWPVISEEQLKEQHSQIAEVIDFATQGIKGPIHINVPISEPLYGQLPEPTAISISETGRIFYPSIDAAFLEGWKNSKRRIILCGQNLPNKGLKSIITAFADENKALVLAEPIANINGDKIITALDRVMMLVEQSEVEEFQPDLLVSFGGPVVSKRLKNWLQKQPNLVHWRIAEEFDEIDTYQNRKAMIPGDPSSVLLELLKINSPSENNFLERWQIANQNSFAGDFDFSQTMPFSDASVFYYILNNLPEGVTLHLGNSSPVRYAQLYSCVSAKCVYSNRGVSGIDGCLSTASGIATVTKGLNLVLIGDLSFVYDSNALWNRNLPSNLHVVVINNGGGGIFRLLPGPSEQDCFEDFMEANHPVNIQKLSEAFGLNYFKAKDHREIKKEFNTFIQSEGPSLLEIFTPTELNPIQFKLHIENIKANKYDYTQLGNH